MLKLFDTLEAKKRPFKPLRGKTVRIYTCGPSVYAYSHIGNFRTYLFEDVLVRYLIFKGYAVKRVMNITDIEDKAIEEARRERKTLFALQKGKIKSFFADWRSLGMRKPDIVAKASEHVPEMERLIRRICARGFCKEEKDGIYFDVRKFKHYGDLRRLKNRRYLGTACNDDYSKEGLWDFRLWKRWTKNDGDVRYQSGFGDGRPGWHIECSAMAMKYLGESFDIHCGGSDNIYPHHENEIAQSEAASGKRLANFWIHGSHLTINKMKMSKRTGNVFYVSQLRKRGVPPKCLRFYLLSEKYRCHLDFSMERFGSEICHCKNVRGLLARIRRVRLSGDGRTGKRFAKKLLDGFENAMDDDLNTKLAFRRIFRVFQDIEKDKKLTREDALAILSAMARIDEVLGVF
jgi:cysteinyl-tRNA synthetase